MVDWVNASAGPLELAERHREAMTARVARADLERAMGFAAAALLCGEPENPFAVELQTAIPWR